MSRGLKGNVIELLAVGLVADNIASGTKNDLRLDAPGPKILPAYHAN